MKKTHLIGIGILAVMVLVIISSIGDASTYVTFDEAKALYTNGKSKKVHVVGQLKKDEHGQAIGISPSADKLTFTFLMVDNNKNLQKVFYKEPMPPDFLRSEQVVVVGKYTDDVFVADQILMKCPSKYQEESVKVEGIRELNL
jgi:cytochrome c-type biogenesis protein CcmE